MKRRLRLMLVITIIGVFGIGGCTEPNPKESTTPQVRIEDVQDDETSDAVEEIQIEAEDTKESSVETTKSSEDAEYVILREDAFYFISEFLIAFNNFDEETLKNVMTEDFYNDIIEFKRAHPTEEELEKALIEASETYLEAFLNGETGIKDYSILKLIGKIDISDFPTSSLSSEYYNPRWNIIDGRDAMAVSIKIITDGVGSGAPDIGYSLDLGFTIFYDENGNFLVKSFGPIYIFL